MRSFATDAMRPIARDCDEAAAAPDSFLAQAWELGLVPTQLPESTGGYGETRSPLTNTIVLGLPEEQKFVVEQLYFQGYSQSELAEEFSIPLGTVKTRLRLAMNQLRSITKLI
jgi:DNA-directed RNA polymerase specialized sigma24 family protein